MNLIKNNDTIDLQKHAEFLQEYDSDMKKALTIVTDMDEVLVNIAPTWVANILANKELFEEFFNLDQEFTKQLVDGRSEYYLNTWLAKDTNKEIPLGINELFFSLYNRKDFYKNLPPTRICDFLSRFSQTDYCKEIIVISDTIPGMEVQKVKWINNVFENNSKIKFIPVDGIPKSDVINGLNIDYDTFIDDKLSNVSDIIVNTNCSKKEILIPKKGYNQYDEYVAALAEAAYVNVQYYNED